jgi:hypothetical protein
MKHGFWNSSFLCYFTNGQMMIGMNHFINFLDNFFIFWCWRSSWTFNVLNWSSALFKMFVPLMGLCSTHGFVSKCLFKHYESLPKTLPLIWNKISNKHFTHETHPFLFTEKFAQ